MLIGLIMRIAILNEHFNPYNMYYVSSMVEYDLRHGYFYKSTEFRNEYD